MKDKNKNNSLNLEFPNLIPLLYFEYRASALNFLKQVFMENLQKCIEYDKEYCRRHKIEPVLTQEKIDHIINLLNQCSNVYELQALNDYIFLENYIPTLDEVKSRGIRLKIMYPLLEAKRRIR